jgi:hypothetical protein
MKLINIIVLTLFLIGFCFCQTLPKSKILKSREFEFGDTVIVECDSIYYKGYLIFQIDKSPYQGYYPLSEEFYICNIFWINNLQDITDKSKYFYCDSFISLDLPRRVFKGDEPLIIIETGEIQYPDTNVDSKLSEVVNKYSAYLSKNITVSPFMSNTMLTTELFITGITFFNYYDENTVGYYIFENSFDGFILKGTLNYYDHNKEKGVEKGLKKYESVKIEDARVLVPFSKAYIFQPVADSILIANGFKRSRWEPENLLYYQYQK